MKNFFGLLPLFIASDLMAGGILQFGPVSAQFGTPVCVQGLVGSEQISNDSVEGTILRHVPLKVPLAEGVNQVTFQRGGNILTRVNSVATPYGLVAGFIQLDETGLNVFRFGQDGVRHSAWRPSRTSAKLRYDTIGPKNLQISDLGDRGIHILYTNEMYVHTTLIEEFGTHDARSEMLPDTYPWHSDSMSGFSISHILPVLFTRPSGEVLTLYWAQAEKYYGGLFYLDSETGRAVFFRKNRSISDFARELASEMQKADAKSLSNIVSDPRLFIAGLPAQFIGHFLAEDPQLKEGGRYHYLTVSR
ncbi:hypothetical protein K2X33_10205 [bacterium]|nr:hypothetical protein [bacterium]